MQNHTRPGRYEAVIENLRADKGADYAYAPHTRNACNKGHNGLAHTLHHTLDNYRNTVEGLGERNHSKHRYTERDNRRI